uniref:Oxysterol-binding protein n=1 Tax=Ciona savignyi TaxID=51511 RepID=H2YQU2_CIOSA
MAVYIMEGPLSKWTNVMKGWQYRWFVLDDNAGLLSYYTSKEKMMRGSRRGCVRLRDAIIGIDDEDDSTFTITVDQKVFHFQARDDDERKEWTGALEDTILRHKILQVEPHFVPSLEEFDRKLAEADAYLQLLIENETRIFLKFYFVFFNGKGLSHSRSTVILEMIEAITKSIMLLQLAKVCFTDMPHERHKRATVLPISPTPSIPILTQQQVYIPTESADTFHQTESICNVAWSYAARRYPSPPRVTAPTSLDVECSALTTRPPPMYQSMPQAPHLPLPTETSLPPATSYSSSEDEGDEFYDADEDIRSSKSSLEANQNIEPSSATLQAIDVNSVDCVPSVEEEILKVDSDVVPHENGDMFMQEENSNDNKDGESVEEHKSVIMHLLSQVKLGMDLTKVVLPTFILERRSLLEMYADFFAHPDLFVEVGEKETAEERMVACLRFYLSTFSAGRNSSVAKKPYNPIIGETFQCIYHVPPGLQGPEQPTVVADGPIPWAKSNQLTFYSEQVSHHPPVSAFYTELKDKRMQFNGHIWTKSKFLGLSIGVHNIGQGCLRLLDRDEEYIINFPNGYGRSILTVPWVELGGDCTITCEKTGYNAFIKFHTKPFYGGKAHRISAEIFAPNEKKPLCTVEGDWNDHMFIKYTSGCNDSFFNAKKKMKTQKLVRKIELQGELESRRLWEKVTFNLHNNNIDEATDGKRFLEDRQRAEAKHRLENGIVYKPKLFHEDDCQNWIFNNPLTARTSS